MYLQKLEINGFKSFAKKVEFEFPENSITAIVGPNGSGKSNVLDAIKWVLGEQSSKNIRSQNSKDILFTSAKYKNVNLAEVHLYLNNESQRFPLEYTDIQLSRYFYRSGDSEYKLNKNPIKVSDLNYLLAKANIGQKSFSIIDQGTIHQLLHFNKERMQEFFADATGIKAYQLQLKQSYREIEKSREQLTYVNNIINELLPRLNLLKKEIDKLEKRKKYLEKLNYYKEQKEALLYKKYIDELEQTKNNLIFYFEEKKKLELKKDGLEKEIENITKILSNDQFLELNKKYQNLLKKREELYQHLNNEQIIRIPDLDKKIEMLKKEIFDLENTIKEKEEFLKQYEGLDLDSLNYFSSPLENFVKKAKQENSLVYGFVKDLFQADKKYLLAIETALGARLNSVLVEDENIAINLIKKLKKEKIGSLSFYPINKIKERKNSDEFYYVLENYEGVNSFLDLLNFEEKFQKVFAFLFNNTLLVDDLDQAKELYKKYTLRLITLNGDIFETSGVIKGGYKKLKYLSKDILQSIEENKKDLLQLKNSLQIKENELDYYLNLQNKNNDKQSVKNYESEIRKINLELKEIEEKVKTFTNDYQKAQSEFSQKQEGLNNVNNELNKIESLLENLEKQKNNIELKLNNLNIKANVNLDFTDLAELEALIMRYENYLMNIGEVDESIIQEYEKVQKKYENLLKEEKDLENSIENLKDVIQSLKKKIEKQFKTKIKEIDQIFNEYFQILFKGGKAKLLADFNDGEINVDIEPVIPGKKVKSFYLFSGGEKTLLSTALILAIVQSQKTPFLVLDEVDAALDEMNSQQLASILQDINKVTQIILITHNKLIMQIADILYGVTMHSNGYSDVYSLKL